MPDPWGSRPRGLIVVELTLPKVLDPCRDVAGHQSDVDGSVDVGGSAVALEVRGDDLVAPATSAGITGPNVSPDMSPP